MKLICQGLDFSEAISKVTKAIGNKNTNPIMEGIKLVAKKDSLTIFATDLEIAIEKTILADVLIEGETIVPGKFFSEFVRKLSGEQIELSLNEKQQLKVRYLDSTSVIQCFSVEQYPEFEKIEEGKSFSILQSELKDVIAKTIFSVSGDEGRPVLKGCLIEVENFAMTAVALDGYRLAMVKKPVEKSSEKISVIVPARSLSEISRLLESDNSIVTVKIKENFLAINLGHTTISTRLINGEFINYKQIIPTSFSTNVIINRNQFENSLERASILAKGDKNNLVRFDLKENLLCLSSNSEIGEIKENISISLSGKDMSIAFNARYLNDCTKVLHEDFIKISFNSTVAPCVITNCENEEFLYLILPVRMA